MDKTTYFYPNKTLNCGGRIVDLSTTRIMGILNTTPDSFYDGGKYQTPDEALRRVEKMIGEGADFIDIGGMSSRPGAEIIDVEPELTRVIPVLAAVVKRFPEIPVSVDTIHSRVAIEAVSNGASLINDISASQFDKELVAVAAKYKIPYILMHMQGIPSTMQESPDYHHVTSEVFRFLVKKTNEFYTVGVPEIVIDPGFGFGKTLEQNYQLVKDFEIFQQAGLPVLAGISRKSLICKLLKVNPPDALNGTTALHTILLQRGVNILRVHDVKEARQTIDIVSHSLPIRPPTIPLPS